MAKPGGFTLVECVVTLAILGGLMALAAPGFADFIRSLQLTAASNDVFMHLVLARSEAIRRNGRVALCRSRGGLVCEAGTPWEEGGLLFEDHNNNAQREPEERIVQRLPPLPAGFRLLANAPLASYVSYGGYGAAQYVSGAFQAGTFTVCHVTGGHARRIVINVGGRPRVERVWVDACG